MARKKRAKGERTIRKRPADREGTELEAAAQASACWCKSPQPFELSFRGRVEDGTATVELVRA